MKTITVLIAARNEEKTLPRTLRSIQSQTRKPEQIIVVDDGSTDRTGWISTLYGADRVIRLAESTGKKSRAQNTALPFITGDLVITVDADTELAPDAIEKLVAVFEKKNPPKGACGLVLPRKVRGVWQRGRLIEYLFGQVYYKFLQGGFNAVLVASGCFACYDVSVIVARGGFEDPELTGSDKMDLTEDMGITMWIVTEGKEFGRGGWRVEFVKDAIAYTLDPETFQVYRGQIKRWYAGFFQNLKLYYKPLKEFRNPVLSIFILGLLIDGLLGSFLFFLIPLMAWYNIELTKLWHIVATSTGIELGIVTFFSLYKGFRLKRFWQTLVSLPFFLVTSVVNRAYFLQAFWREIWLNKPLSHWDKGH